MSSAPTTATLPAGTRLAHYELGEPLGSGAMGVVYRAHDLGLDRGVAVKVLRDTIADDPRLVERFVREARAAARVSHPNLTHVYYVGNDAGRPFFAMEFVDGRNLEEAVRADGPLPYEVALEALVQAARGLAAAHAAGVVHRDVKPSNLIQRADGVVKVTDFGLARSIRGDVDGSGAGQVTGTPTYMSPEQVRGEGVDPRSDIYALGLTAFYLLAGEAPFPGPTLGKVLSDQLHAPLPPLSELRSDLPAGVDETLARLCAKDPARRPDSMLRVVGLFEALRPRSVERAALAARVAAVGIDAMIVAVLWAAIQFLLVNVFRLAPGRQVEGLFHLALWTATQLGLELSRQASVGKLLLHLAVVRLDGLRPAPRKLLLRFLVRSPDVLVLPVLIVVHPAWAWPHAELAALLAFAVGLVCWFVTRGRTLSDMLTGTTVAYRHTVIPAQGLGASGGPLSAPVA